MAFSPKTYKLTNEKHKIANNLFDVFLRQSDLFSSADTPSTVRGQFVTTSYKMNPSDDVTKTCDEPQMTSAKLAINEPANLKLYLCQTLKMLAKNPPSIPYRQVCIFDFNDFDL